MHTDQAISIWMRKLATRYLSNLQLSTTAGTKDLLRLLQGTQEEAFLGMSRVALFYDFTKRQQETNYI